MSRAKRSAVAALVVLTVVGLLWPSPRSDLDANSFGTVPPGHRALFELLTELGLPVARSYQAAARLGPGGVVWWIEPRGVCRADGADATQGEGEPPDAPGWDPRPWLADGGTAVVFLPTRPYWSAAGGRPRLVEDARCERLGPFALPPREAAAEAEEGEGDALARGGEADESAGELFEDWWSGELGEPSGASASQRAEGPRLPRVRVLEGPPLRRFLAPGEFRVVVRLDGEPFVLERAQGGGRLVVVSDGSFLTNQWLDRADAAPLALDLVRAFGTPALDERQHGLRREQRPLVYLAGSPALAVFAGLGLLGLLALWWGTALPRRAVAEADPSAPELERFVDSLATLYARSRDHGHVARRYRELSLARLRRHFGLAPDTPGPTVVARLRRERRLDPEDLAALDPEAAPPVTGAAELRAAARRLDAIVKEACR